MKEGRLREDALPAMIDAAAGEGLLTEAEAEALRAYDRKVMAIVHVDDFDPKELAAAGAPPARDADEHYAASA